MSVQRSFEVFLESAGFKFKSFGSAESFLLNEMPSVQDLLLLDINLPVMNGLDLLGLLDHEQKQVPTVVITAFDDAYTRESCKRYGVKAYLCKPVDGEILMKTIKLHTGSSKKAPDF